MNAVDIILIIGVAVLFVVLIAIVFLLLKLNGNNSRNIGKEGFQALYNLTIIKKVVKATKESDNDVEEFLKLEKEDFLVQFVNHPKILDLSKEDKDTINSILNKY